MIYKYVFVGPTTKTEKLWWVYIRKIRVEISHQLYKFSSELPESKECVWLSATLIWQKAVISYRICITLWSLDHKPWSKKNKLKQLQ